MSSSTWRFQAKSYSAVWMTARAAEVAFPPLHLHPVEEGPVRDVVVRIQLMWTTSFGRKSTHRYGPVPTGFMLAGASRDFAPLNGSKTCFG